MSVKCPYCDRDAQLVTGVTIYPHRDDLRRKHFWLCAPCNAYVGTHQRNRKMGLSGDEPLGRLAFVPDMDWWIHEDENGNRGAWWNPLNDDADAFRLMVKLELIVTNLTPIDLVSAVSGISMFIPQKERQVAINGNPYAATRRAIVRCAAEIGKGMK
ncbi:MAG: DUF3268 family zinc-finger domain-containing protein [Gallionellaceae bacterium]|jgi:hypothetical protein|nr:DUF3268 family zinc-finger domain-containing protein [Gallionellaceae bacterium]